MTKKERQTDSTTTIENLMLTLVLTGQGADGE